MTSKEQVTFPKPIRDKRCIGLGDKIEFMVVEDGRALIHPSRQL